MGAPPPGESSGASAGVLGAGINPITGTIQEERETVEMTEEEKEETNRVKVEGSARGEQVGFEKCMRCVGEIE